MDTHNIQFVGAPCGRHAQNTFYKALKYLEDGKYKILTLGEFFYMKISKLSPVCVGELQMIYSIKQQEDVHVMTSVRTYFLPEHTPEGRQETHGEDELFAFSEKLILKAEDLVCLLEDGVRWTWGRRLFQEDELEGDITNSDDLDQRMTIRNCGMNFSDVDKEKEAIGYTRSESSTQLTILSYPQYCRYRAVLRRLEHVKDKWLKSVVICAIGGIISKSKDNRIMFCRETFYDADLETLEINCEHLAPNLKGRKRRKRSSIMGENGESDSNDVSSEYSIPTVPKEKTGKRESALRNGFRIDKMRVSKDEQEFLFSLHKFMKKRNSPIGRIPSLGFKQIDLYMFWSHAMKIGGYAAITQKRMWKHLYDILGGNPGSTSAATCTRRHYEKLLLPYERHTRGDLANRPLPLKSKKCKILGRPPGKPLGRPPKDKEKKTTPDKTEMRESPKEVMKESPTVVSEDKLMNRIKRRERFKLKLQEKALKWEELRNQKAKDRDKVKRGSSNPRTVKNILNSAMANKSKSEVESSKENKQTEETSENVCEAKIDITAVKKEPSDLLASPTKHVANQSKLFRPPDVQSTSAKIENKILSQANPAISLCGPHHPSQQMFYPHPFVQLGAMHPLGLPIINQLPMAMQQYLQPNLPAAKPVHRPNILRSPTGLPKSFHVSSVTTEQDKMAALALFQQPAHTNNHHSNIPSQLPGKSPITPPAHAHQKRSHESLYSPKYDIPSHSKSLSNKSLLFDFETSKRMRKDSDTSVNSKTKSATEDEQPQDLSMKTLCKKSESNSDNNVLRQQSSSSSSKDSSVKSQRLEMTLNLPKHSMANILKTPVFSKRSSSPSNVFSNKSPVFSSPSSHSSTKGDILQTTSPCSQPSVISPVHPAFPQHFLRSPVPQPGMFPSQLQQLYEAQIRATQVAALEEMMQRDHNMYPRMPFPMFMPQMPLHMNNSKDKNNYAHAK
ncbi:AT-rich interactive domain-containing protein 5B-like isoform X2 [Mytilus californianus]|uniref:AT-rich interactive domain-containing protein 5B-like isoform X2 n=1 Tax=Mytilus californianus TaxID=6549 RepID=UPI00224629FA|nr:AT-rich interactive domain-containing protein 5B-like isoform X2 [Mytilus californianus]